MFSDYIMTTGYTIITNKNLIRNTWFRFELSAPDETYINFLYVNRTSC